MGLLKITSTTSIARRLRVRDFILDTDSLLIIGSDMGIDASRNRHVHTPQTSQPIDRLYAAVRNYDVNTVRAILEENNHEQGFLNRLGLHEYDPVLSIAVLYDRSPSHIEIVKLLVTHGAEINEDGSLDAPIALAVKNLSYELVNYFIESGAYLLDRFGFLGDNLLQVLLHSYKFTTSNSNKMTAMLELLVPALRKAGLPESEIEAAKRKAESLEVFDVDTLTFKTVNLWPQRLWEKNREDAQLVPYQPYRLKPSIPSYQPLSFLVEPRLLVPDLQLSLSVEQRLVPYQPPVWKPVIPYQLYQLLAFHLEPRLMPSLQLFTHVERPLVSNQRSYVYSQQTLFANQERDFVVVNEEDATEKFEVLDQDEINSAKESESELVGQQKVDSAAAAEEEFELREEEETAYAPSSAAEEEFELREEEETAYAPSFSLRRGSP
jgi:hypothetical protein